MNRSPRSSIQLPGPITPVLPPASPAVPGQIGASSKRWIAVVANQVSQVIAREAWLVGILVLGGAATATVYAIDTATEENAVERRKAPVRVAAGGYDGWLQGPAIHMEKGIAITCDQIDAEIFIYWVPGGA